MKFRHEENDAEAVGPYWIVTIVDICYISSILSFANERINQKTQIDISEELYCIISTMMSVVPTKPEPLAPAHGNSNHSNGIPATIGNNHFKDGNKCHLDISDMDDLLGITDKNTSPTARAWMDIRGSYLDDNGSIDYDKLAHDDDDDNSIVYLADAVSDFFGKICFCGDLLLPFVPNNKNRIQQRSALTNEDITIHFL